MAIVEEMLRVFEITTGRVLLERNAVVLLPDGWVLSVKSDAWNVNKKLPRSLEPVRRRCGAENGRERLCAGGSGRYRKREHREGELCLSL